MSNFLIVILNVIKLNVVMVGVIRLSVVAPQRKPKAKGKKAALALQL
jgi:hypothetical protein